MHAIRPNTLLTHLRIILTYILILIKIQNKRMG